MKYYSNSTLSWGEDGTGDNIKVPIPLPRVTKVWKQEVSLVKIKIAVVIHKR